MSRDIGRLHMRYWHDRGACKGTERKVEVDGKEHEATELFFPPRVKETYAIVAAEAKKHCHGENGRRLCPVRDQCLEWAIETNELWGIYGGMSHRERNALVRKRHRKAQEAGEQCITRCIVCEDLPDEEPEDD